jgi:exopolyphosphatase/guanosine-5'-triphosphate,3'-diphosphate pyrophosphatase
MMGRDGRGTPHEKSQGDAMSTPVVLECGSNSLKAHYRTVTSGIFQKVTFPWRLGHEVYETGRLSEETLKQAIEAIDALLKRGFERRYILPIATGALRDAENPSDLVGQLRERLGLEVRVISGREEASLLAQGYLKTQSRLPALIADIGGGSLELVHLSTERTVLRDSLPLGAIRLYYLGVEDGKTWNRQLVESWIASAFEEASLVKASELHGTGGTMKCIAKVLKKNTVTPGDLSALIDRVASEGPPAELSQSRQTIFLPGILAMKRLLEHCGASKLHHTKVSIGRMFLERLLDRLGASISGTKKNVLLQDMRITNIYPRL